MSSDQAADAQRLYDDRAAHYNDSWHPRFARHIVDLLALKRGEHVLDLACDTGLVSFAAAEAVGPTGSVIGVDISTGMLAQAQRKLLDSSIDNVSFYQHSITSLTPLDAVRGKQFDAIACTSALVLLTNPALALKHWTRHLKSGGRLIADVTHIRSQLGHLTLERVGRELGRPVPSYRLAFQTPADLESMLVRAGLVDVETKLVAQMRARGAGDGVEAYVCDVDKPLVARTYEIEDGEAVFEKLIGSAYGEALAVEDVKDRARELFIGEWAKLANDDGKIEEVDGVFVAIGRKPS